MDQSLNEPLIKLWGTIAFCERYSYWVWNNEVKLLGWRGQQKPELSFEKKNHSYQGSIYVKSNHFLWENFLLVTFILKCECLKLLFLTIVLPLRVPLKRLWVWYRKSSSEPMIMQRVSEIVVSIKLFDICLLCFISHICTLWHSKIILFVFGKMLCIVYSWGFQLWFQI